MGRPVNERQLEVLRWIADGCPEGKWAENDNAHKISAAALKFRGLATITGRGRAWTATVTDAGMHYLEYGTYPPSVTPTLEIVAANRASRATPTKLDLGEGASETLTEAKILIKQLQEQEKLTVTDPDESVRARYRRILHACRTQHLVPAGQELRFTGRSSGDIVIMLTSGSPADTANWDRIRTTARTVTTNLNSIRAALETTSILYSVSEDLRPRAIEVVLGLAEQLRSHGLRLSANIKLKTPKLFIQVDSRRRNLEMTEILDEVPHVPTDAEQRELRRSPWKQIPKFDSVPSGRLRLKIERDGWHQIQFDRQSYGYERNNDSWCDEKKPLEGRIREIARAIKEGVVDDTDTLEREKQRRAEAQEAHEREQAAQRRAWEAVRERAREKALLAQREAIFARTFESWQGAQELRDFSRQLEAEATAQGLLQNRPRLREWLEWARTRADEIDPIANLGHLDDEVFNAEPSADDLRPHMEGWDPSRPHKDYKGTDREPAQQPTYMPQPRSWHLGMRDRPSWWRH